MRYALVLLSMAFAAACDQQGGSPDADPEPAVPPAATPQITGTEWMLVELDGSPAPLGAGDRPATLLLGDSARASGFGGCNRIAGKYELSGDSVRIGPLISTKMACDRGMELERAYGTALEGARGYRVTTEGLELLGPTGVVAKFRRGEASPGG